MKDISVLIPVYNEEATVSKCIERLLPVLEAIKKSYEIIFVDDGSCDSTWDILKEKRRMNEGIRAIRLSRNFGQQAAYTAGLKAARGSFVMMMDVDLQDPPELLNEFIKKHEEGYDVVYAVRKNRKEGPVKLFLYKAFYRMLRYITSDVNDVEMVLDAGDFGLISRKVVDALNSLPEHNRYIRGLRSWVGFRQVGIPYERQARSAGEVRYTWKKLFRLANDGVFSFSYFPIALLGWLGFVLLILSLAGIIYSIVINSGFALSALLFVCALSLIGSFQLLGVWVIGQYIARTYDETKNRPMYIVREVIE